MRASRASATDPDASPLSSLCRAGAPQFYHAHRRRREATAAAFALAKKGDLQAVINSIASSPALVRATDVNGWTLLHVFARLSLAPAVKQLLMLGAAPEARDATFRSALHLAARADALVPGAPRDGDAAVGRRRRHADGAARGRRA